MSIPIYCINLRSRPDRQQRMMDRFNEQKISFEFVEAISKESHLIKFYRPDNGGNSGEVGCFASHLKAIRRFLEGKDPWGIICEDDILLIKDFSTKLSQLVSQIPDNTQLVTLSYFVHNWNQFKWTNEANRLFLSPAKSTLGTQMYLIHYTYALGVIDKFDKPHFGLGPSQTQNILRTSERIVQNSQGLLSYPLLAIEDCLDSDIRPEDHLRNYHDNNFAQWNYFNYADPLRDSNQHSTISDSNSNPNSNSESHGEDSNRDKEKISPLINFTLDKIWHKILGRT